MSVLEYVSFSSVDEGEYLWDFRTEWKWKNNALKITSRSCAFGRTIQMFGQSAMSRAMRSRGGTVPQRIAQTDMHFPATVEEVVLSGRTSFARVVSHGWTKEDRHAMLAAMDWLEITNLRHRQIGQLSAARGSGCLLPALLRAN